MAPVRNQADTYLSYLVLKSKGNHTGVFTTCDIPPSEIIVKMQGNVISEPNNFSIQIETDRHLDKGGLIDDEMNHSCDANARIEFSDMTIRAKRHIRAGEEICINYCATEDLLSKPFECDCGSPLCYRNVKGFHYLKPSQKEALKADLSPYLKKQYFPN